jgi:hypothetical protein
MAPHKYYMHVIQPKRPLCKYCGVSPAKSRGKSKLGYKIWHTMCSSCSRKLYNDDYKHLNNKKNICEECNFKAIDACQLDLIYIDGDINNKDISNLKTLCANCSRLLSKNKSENRSILDITIDNDIDISNL